MPAFTITYANSARFSWNLLTTELSLYDKASFQVGTFLKATVRQFRNKRRSGEFAGTKWGNLQITIYFNDVCMSSGAIGLVLFYYEAFLQTLTYVERNSLPRVTFVIYWSYVASLILNSGLIEDLHRFSWLNYYQTWLKKRLFILIRLPNGQAIIKKCAIIVKKN